MFDYILSSSSFFPILITFAGVYALHFAADFVADPMVITQKTSCNAKVLTSHIFTYAAILLNYYFIISLFFVALSTGHSYKEITALIDDQIILTLINVISHAVIDYFICKPRAKAFANRNMRLYWSYFGLDQTLHMIFLTTTTAYYSHLLTKIFF